MGAVPAQVGGGSRAPLLELDRAAGQVRVQRRQLTAVDPGVRDRDDLTLAAEAARGPHRGHARHGSHVLALGAHHRARHHQVHVRQIEDLAQPLTGQLYDEQVGGGGPRDATELADLPRHPGSIPVDPDLELDHAEIRQRTAVRRQIPPDDELRTDPVGRLIDAGGSDPGLRTQLGQGADGPHHVDLAIEVVDDLEPEPVHVPVDGESVSVSRYLQEVVAGLPVGREIEDVALLLVQRIERTGPQVDVEIARIPFAVAIAIELGRIEDLAAVVVGIGHAVGVAIRRRSAAERRRHGNPQDGSWQQREPHLRKADPCP